MVWAFGRLHRHAPSADTTSDLVAQVLGVRTGVFTGLLQLVGYLLLGAGFAKGVGLAVPLWFTVDVDAVRTGSWWPACSVAAALLTTLGLALLGIEAVTTLSGRVSSVSRPMGLAVAVIALCATTGWVAVARASSAVGLAFDESWIVLLNADFFDSSGGYWLVSGSLALGSAALLAITLAAVRVAARLTQQITHRQHIGAVTIGAASVMSLLVLGVTQDWGGTGSKLVFVAPLLLLAVYMAVAEANSRLPGSGEAAMAVGVLMPRSPCSSCWSCCSTTTSTRHCSGPSPSPAPR